MATSKRSGHVGTAALGRPAMQIVVVGLFIAALFTLYYRGEAKRRWDEVQGSVPEERISPAYATQIMGSHVVWKVEYKVGYAVAGHEYSVWTDSGYKATARLMFN